MKQEASGWPSDVGDDPIKRQQYLRDYEGREGIRLDEANIEKNPGKRSLAKGAFFYPSFWNKNGWYGMHSQHSGHSAPGSRMDGMAFCPFRNRNAE